MGTCPDDRQLQLFLDGAIDQPIQVQIDAHLEDCESCQHRVEAKVAVEVQHASCHEILPDAFAQAVVSQLASPPAESEDVSLGVARHIGAYQTIAKIGAGGMGTIYLAEHVNLRKRVALKVLKKAHSPSLQARFAREMESVGRLSHPNIVQATDAGNADGVSFIAMELLDGSDVGKLAATPRLSIADACEIVRQAAIGLQHAHKKGLIHRDIKPSNLMVTCDGVVKILDLGLARLSDQPQEDEEITLEGQVLGTLDYMSPEQYCDPESVSTASDIYSLGATLFRLLTGEPPFGHKTTTAAKVKSMAVDSAPPIRERAPNLSPDLADLVDQMLQRDPELRIRSADDVAKQLARYCEASQLANLVDGTRESLKGTVVANADSTGLETVAPTKAETSSAFSLWIVGVLLVATVIGFGVMYANRSSDAVSADTLAKESNTDENLAAPVERQTEPPSSLNAPPDIATMSNLADSVFLSWWDNNPNGPAVMTHTHSEIFRELSEDAVGLFDAFSPKNAFKNKSQKTRTSLLGSDRFVTGVELWPGSMHDELLKRLGELPHLRWVNLHQPPTRPFSKDWTERIPMLPSVWVFQGFPLGDSFTNHHLDFLEKLPNLRGLLLFKCALDDDGYVQLAKMAPTHLPRFHHFSGGHKINARGLRALCGIKTLKDLGLAHNQLTDTDLQILKESNVERLLLGMMPVSDASISTLLEMPKLEALFLHCRTTRFTLQGLCELKSHPTLKEITFDHLTVDEFDRVSSKFPRHIRVIGWNLQEDLAKVVADPDSPVLVSNHSDLELLQWMKKQKKRYEFGLNSRDQILQELGPNPIGVFDCSLLGRDLPPAVRNLEMSANPDSDTFITGLVLHARDLNDAFLDRLTTLAYLRVLGFNSGIAGSHVDALKVIPRMDSVWTLDIAECKTAFSDVLIQQLKKFPNLRGIKITRTNVTDDGLVQLADLAEKNLPHLQRFVGSTRSNRGMKALGRISTLTHIRLANSGGNDSGLVALETLPLKELSIHNMPVTDGCIDSILKLSDLESFTMSWTKITPTGVKRLKSHPSLKEIKLDGFTLAEVNALVSEFPSRIAIKPFNYKSSSH